MLKLLIGQFAVSCALLSLIWIVQLVHYPAFLYIDQQQFKAFQQFHMQSISYVVAPLMFIELGLAAWTVYQFPSQWAFWTILVIVILLWLSTFFVSVPYHNKLVLGKDVHAIKMLVQTNWIRTALWTAKAIFTGYLLFRHL